MRTNHLEPHWKHANITLDVIILAAMGEETAIEGKEAPRGA